MKIDLTPFRLNTKEERVHKTMTDDQVKELFSLIGTSISETREVRKIVEEHSEILDQHSAILNQHSAILKDLTEKLDLLINRTGDNANTVIVNDKQLTRVEKDVTEIRGGVH